MSPVAVTPASFIGRSREEVSKRLLQRLTMTDTTYQGEGSIIRAIMEAVALEMGNAYALVNFSWGQQVVTLASGSSLDALGVLYGVTRRQVSYESSQSAFYFYLASTSNHQVGVPNATASVAFTIPKGTIIRLRDDVIGDAYSYQTTTDVKFAQGDSVHWATLTPVIGAERTNMAPHTLRVHDYVGTGHENLYCTNPIELNTNASVETDNDLRVRIMDAIKGLASATNLSIRLAALAIDHVRDAKVIERPYGPGTLRVRIVLDSGGGASQIEAVNSAVDLVRPAGSYVTIAQAIEIPIELTYGYTTSLSDPMGSVQKSIEAAARGYINSLGMGQGFNRGVLVERMFQAAPTADNIYVTSIRIDGRNFVGDSYKVSDESVVVLSSLTKV
jgi:uncharacterized phage protein gp47/JayE